MTIPAFLAALQKRLRRAGRPWGRGAWCRRHRRSFLVPGHSVVWVRGDAMPWAEWGARRGYFDIGYMNGLPYLRARRAPPA